MFLDQIDNIERDVKDLFINCVRKFNGYKEDNYKFEAKELRLKEIQRKSIKHPFKNWQKYIHKNNQKKKVFLS